MDVRRDLRRPRSGGEDLIPVYTLKDGFLYSAISGPRHHEIVDAIATAPMFDGRRHVHRAGGLMAHITAGHLIQHPGGVGFRRYEEIAIQSLERVAPSESRDVLMAPKFSHLGAS
jgi:hypothetical protein